RERARAPELPAVELEQLLDAGVERLHRRQAEVADPAGNDDDVLRRVDGIVGGDVVREKHRAVTLAQHEVAAKVQAPRTLVVAVGVELVGRQREIDVRLAAPGGEHGDEDASDLWISGDPRGDIRTPSG